MESLGHARKLTIYVDESRTMPGKQGDGRFCVTAIGTTLEDFSGLLVPGWQKSNLATVMSQGRFRGTACVVDSDGPGFGVGMSSRAGALGRVVQALREKNVELHHIPASGINWRNYIWIQVTAQAVGMCLADHLFIEPVSSVRIVYDRKTLKSESERLFAVTLKQLRARAVDSIDRMGAVETDFDRRMRNRIRFADDDVTVEPATGNAGSREWAGLKLAHHVSRWVGGNPSAAELALATDPERGNSPRFSVVDVSSQIAGAPPEAVVRRWEALSGLSREQLL